MVSCISDNNARNMHIEIVINVHLFPIQVKYVKIIFLYLYSWDHMEIFSRDLSFILTFLSGNKKN